MKIAAYDDMIDLIAMANPERIIAYQPSKKTLQRVQELVLKKSGGILNAEEERELDYYIWLENLIGLAKARAHQLLLQVA
ncbi:MAG: hypothetical protein IPM98_16360 [Lewinellaceae bacterium]|nr:hypothetical protein [Lewinellaceae bacterium]